MQNAGLSAPSAIQRSTTPSAPYSRRPPSPPYIPIPHAPRHEAGQYAYTVAPCEANLAASRLTREQLFIITRGKAQTATDMAATWTYEQRREAQQILDYMCIGPTSIARDETYLRNNNISLVVIVRDARMSDTRLLGVDKACDACNISPYYVNIGDLFDLIRTLPEIFYIFNMHMIGVHTQTRDAATGEARVGNILVTCDSGNDRSAAVVAAYIMAVYGASMAKAVQFVSIQRFCCTFDEDVKRILQTWEDLLRAQAAVSANQVATQYTVQPKKNKRCVDDMVDADMDLEDLLNSDRERFMERKAFAPFVDME
ncbi:dual specificity phosphatase [Beauveria bassiana ARSEF 2860]|uniref:Dual specificity phosphatase n=1 Tax=Beauveria bassiana (strain ARSEF 2860) TaxID=655819 RepID=J4VX52_BEAB2|nr:dual specificity phosphatase [Beauveria bassiana ARSEF 2860]EJP62970.1 dual specificity phosphatase [Beauveria bassiana ARSEF 2860]